MKNQAITPEYLDWLVEVTHLGYDRDIMILTEHGAFMDSKFKEGFTPDQAIKMYSDFIGR